MVDSKIERLAITGGPDGAIAIDTITEDNLAPGSVGASELQPIGGESLKDLTITDAKIASVDGSKINTDSISADQIGPGAVGNSELGSNAVGSDNIIPETINGGPGGDIASDTITEYNLADGSVGADQLQPIEGGSIADNAIGINKFDNSAVDRGLDVSTGAIGHINQITGATHNGFSFDNQGHIFDTSPLQPRRSADCHRQGDLGGVIVPDDGGIALNPLGEIRHGVVGDTVSGNHPRQQRSHHCSGTAGTADLPHCTKTDLGAVSVPGPKLVVSGAVVSWHALASGLSLISTPRSRLIVRSSLMVIYSLALISQSIPLSSLRQGNCLLITPLTPKATSMAILSPLLITASPPAISGITPPA